jgi:hypothetical protein
VRSLVTEGECPTMRDDTGLTVELPRIELFEVLTVTP